MCSYWCLRCLQFKKSDNQANDIEISKYVPTEEQMTYSLVYFTCDLQVSWRISTWKLPLQHITSQFGPIRIYGFSGIIISQITTFFIPVRTPLWGRGALVMLPTAQRLPGAIDYSMVIMRKFSCHSKPNMKWHWAVSVWLLMEFSSRLEFGLITISFMQSRKVIIIVAQLGIRTCLDFNLLRIYNCQKIINTDGLQLRAGK